MIRWFAIRAKTGLYALSFQLKLLLSVDFSTINIEMCFSRAPWLLTRSRIEQATLV